MKLRWIPVVAAMCSAVLADLGGCVQTPTRDDTIAPDAQASLGRIEIEDASYDEVFSAARRVLRDYRFAINRIDAARGVITSYPKQSVGLASFWDQEQSSAAQEFEELVNQQERTIRVTVERPAEGAQSSVRASVEVLVSRVHRPNWRVETESVRLSTHAGTRDGQGRLGPSEFREPIGQDPALAHRIAKDIADRVE